MPDLHELREIPVDHHLRPHELAEALEAYANDGRAIPVGGDEGDTDGAAAMGWVRRLYARGGQLVADLADLSTTAWMAIRSRPRLKAEVAKDVSQNERHWPTFILRLMVSGVRNISPRDFGIALFAIPPPTPRHEYQKLFRGVVTQGDKPMNTTDDPGVELDRRVREYMTRNAVRDYSMAMHLILAADPRLKHEYAFSGEAGAIARSYAQPRAVRPTMSHDEASDELHRRVTSRLGRGQAKNYSAAMRDVLADDPELRLSYGAV